MITPDRRRALLQEHLEPLRAYIAAGLAEKPEIPEPKLPMSEKPEPPKSDEHISYSMAESTYSDDHIHDLKGFLSLAKKDSAMFNLPALRKAYRRWEKKTAVTKTFSSEVLHRLKESRTRPADFYRAAELDKRVYSSMKRDYCYSPSRNTAVKCCLALRLSFPEADELLNLAGYSLSPGLSRDLAIRFCLENEIYDIPGVNCMLEALGEEPLA